MQHVNTTKQSILWKECTGKQELDYILMHM